MTVSDFKRIAVQKLSEVTDNAAFEASQLMCHVLSCTENQLLINKASALNEKELSVLNFALEERMKHVPIQYICKEWDFHGLKMKCGPGCLIPRPETEMLVEMCIKSLKQGATMLDLCTGSGCIAVSVMKNRPDAMCVAVDISDEALVYAIKNAEFHGVEDRIKYVQNDAFAFKPDKKFDLIVSNPPYIKTMDMENLSPEVKKEPYIALDGGEDGLDFYKLMSSEYKNYLSENGCILVEVGYDIYNEVADLFIKQGFITEIITDMYGVQRIVHAYKKQ